MNKKIKNLIGWIVYLAVLIGLVWGTPKALAYLLDTDYPMASITSGSMWPALKKGDMVLIKGVHSKEDIQIDDVVVYENPKGFTIHRVIKLREDTLVTKGDANNTPDTPIKYEAVIGKALTIKNKMIKIPFLGKIGLIIQRKK
ncbi:unnamed protein product [marine sediment metagenome]|uniref:Uncharacterized protein n=1 Tax=marine sediment metagenome TaxID=412755 RepID=X1RZR2_9ZZZZ